MLVDVVQQSGQWVRERIGMLTASRMAAALAKKEPKRERCIVDENGVIVERLGFGVGAKKKAEKAVAAGQRVEEIIVEPGEEMAARLTEKYLMVAERITGVARSGYVTDAMQWGIDTEPLAADAYEDKTGELLLPAGFYVHNEIQHFGASPDRLLGREGLVEIKCPTTPKLVAWRAAGVVPDEHKPQMLAQLACTRRQYCDFVAFDPRVVGPARLFIRRFEPTSQEIAAVEAAAAEFLDEVERLFELVTQEDA